MTSIIVAKDLNNCIGNANRLPWPRLKKDMEFFREKTKGHAVIMGSKTFASIGKPLKHRHNIVLSRKLTQKDVPQGVQVFSNPLKALKKAWELDQDPFVIGGNQIYTLYYHAVERLYITEIQNTYAGDTFFRPIDDSWKEISCREEMEGEVKLLFKEYELCRSAASPTPPERRNNA